MEAKATSSEELAEEQGYVFLTEIFKELCPEGHQPGMLYAFFVKGAMKAHKEWLKARGEA